ncbi:MAG: TatD family hydrolase [Alphaproteobacteria bacterium]
MLVDSHCHLDFPAFDDDLDDVIQRARDADVGVMQTICTRLSRFDDVRALAARYDDVYCSVGVHPHHVAEEEATAEGLAERARHPKVIGIGETGLDYYYDNSPRATQQASFRAHIRGARMAKLPVIVHSRGADEDTSRVLAEEMEEGPFTGVVHCFSSGRELAERALELGLYLSLSGILTFKDAGDLRAVARDLPTDRLLIETDAPYLAPVPRRGRRNEPAFVAYTAACVARLKGMGLAELAAATTANFFALFRKAGPGAAARA